MPELPAQWYDEVGPGVRRMQPPGVAFDWLDVVLEEAGPDALETAVDELGLAPEVSKSIREPGGESTRIRRAGATILRLELPASVLADATEDAVVTLVITERTLLSVRRHRLGLLEAACHDIEEIGTTDVAILDVAAEIGDEFLDRLGPSLRRIADELDLAETEAEENRTVRIERVTAIRRVLLALDRHLDPLQTALQRWLLDESRRNERADLETLRGLLDRANWMEHRIHGQLDRARILADRDHVLAMDELSTSTYRLGWIATIFLPLTFLTGLLGINVSGIPFANDRAGFWLVCGLLILVAALTTGILAWVGRSGTRTSRGTADELLHRKPNR